MKFILLITLFQFVFLENAQSQWETEQSYGLGVLALNFRDNPTSFVKKDRINPVIVFNIAKKNLLQPMHGIAFNASPSFGIGLNVESGDLDPGFILEVPITFQYRYGNLSEEDSESKYGALFGIGYAFYANTYFGKMEYEAIRNHGFILEAGAGLLWDGKPLTIKFQIIPKLNNFVLTDRLNLFGLTFLYNFSK